MIKVTSHIDEKLMTKFNLHQVNKRLWFPFLATALLVILGVVVMWDDFLGLAGGITLIAAGIVMPLLYIFAARLMAKKSIGNSVMLKSALKQSFTFDGDEIILYEQSQYNPGSELKYDWAIVFKAEETADAFYLYISKVQAFLIDKNGFTEGTAQDLHDLFYERLGKKFAFPRKLYKVNKDA